MVGWHHRLSGHDFEQALGDGEGQGSLACCSTWGHKESDMTKQLNSDEEPQPTYAQRRSAPLISCFLAQPWPRPLHPPGLLRAVLLLQLQLLLHPLRPLQLLLLEPPPLLLLPSLLLHLQPSHLGPFCSQPVPGSLLLFPLDEEGLRSQHVVSDQ